MRLNPNFLDRLLAFGKLHRPLISFSGGEFVAEPSVLISELSKQDFKLVYEHQPVVVAVYRVKAIHQTDGGVANPPQICLYEIGILKIEEWRDMNPAASSIFDVL